MAEWVSGSDGGLQYVTHAKYKDGTVVGMRDGREFSLTWVGRGSKNIYQATYVGRS